MEARDADDRVQRVESLLAASAPAINGQSVMALAAGAELRLLLGDVLGAARARAANAHDRARAADARLSIDDRRADLLSRQCAAAARAFECWADEQRADAAIMAGQRKAPTP